MDPFQARSYLRDEGSPRESHLDDTHMSSNSSSSPFEELSRGEAKKMSVIQERAFAQALTQEQEIREETKKIRQKMESELDLNDEAMIRISQDLQKVEERCGIANQEEKSETRAFLTSTPAIQERLRYLESRLTPTKLEGILPSSKQAASPSLVFFGKRLWETYFGDVGDEPPLPVGIEAILQSPCPYYPEKKLEETHLLTLIPKSVNGKPLTLNLLSALVKSPNNEGFSTKLLINDSVKAEIGEKPVEGSYWALLTQCAVPATPDKEFWEQVVLLKPSYKVPSCLEACVSILAHYVHTGEKLYPYRPQTWTRTAERVEQKERRILVGRFDPVGLSVTAIRSEWIAHEYYGLAGVQKL